MPIPAHKTSPAAHDAAQIHQYGPAVMSKARSQLRRQNGGSARGTLGEDDYAA